MNSNSHIEIECEQVECEQVECEPVKCEQVECDQESTISSTVQRSVVELEPNQCLNSKGAIGLKSTGSNFLDLFANNYRNVLNGDKSTIDSNFKMLFMTSLKAMFENVDLFLKIVKYTRSIKSGKGEKVAYFLMITIFRMMCVELGETELYKKILYWTHDCHKDIMHLSRIQDSIHFISGSGNYLKHECELYSENVRSLIHRILSDQKLNSGDLLWIKYINTPHFSQNSKIIWNLIPQFNTADYHPVTDNGIYVLKLLNTCNGEITNKVARQIKSYFHRELNLMDKIFQGYLPDGRIIECSDDHAEIISKLLEKCASLCNKKSITTINKFNNQDDKQYHSVLINGLNKYKDTIRLNKNKIKVSSSALSTECMEYYMRFKYNKMCGEDSLLEAKLIKVCEEFKQEISFVASIENIVNNINVIIDQSGSMYGEPLNIALYMGLLLWEVLGIKYIYLFSDQLYILDLPEIDGMCQKIEHLYRCSSGCTNLQSVFDHLMLTQSDNKRHINLIMTDCDCDPVDGSSNPFQIALNKLPLHQFCVCNVKETNITFPYQSNCNNVCYLTGNNLTLLRHLIKCLVDSINNDIPISSDQLLECALNKFDTSEFNLDNLKNRINNLDKNEFMKQCENCFHKIKKSVQSNVPKKMVQKPNDN